MWEEIYNFLGVTDFIYFISSPELQDMLFPVKLIFVFFGMFFLAAVIYFMINSSWLQYKFLEDVSEFFSWKSYGQREIAKQWDKIKKRASSGAESDLKLAIIDADDFLMQVLNQRGYEGKDFEESIEKASKLIAPVYEEVLRSHQARNSIVYDPDFKITPEDAKKMLDIYESAIKSIGIS